MSVASKVKDFMEERRKRVEAERKMKDLALIFSRLGKTPEGKQLIEFMERKREEVQVALDRLTAPDSNTFAMRANYLQGMIHSTKFYLSALTGNPEPQEKEHGNS